ncbi:hypothetical protein FOCC_FOCC012739 [Frankliniella occidentalis]|nr:hypothetical protein FOCC_FOCC012739 [Frankliniella occidentalis]
MRTKEEMVEFGDQAIIAREADPTANVYGVKGPTLLSAFLPDLVRCMGIDDLHGLFSGQMKALLDLWFHTPGPYSISDLVDLVDERLKKMKPPFHFQRVPRSIKLELGLFKVPVLHGILPDVYWEHHCKLVSAVSLLSQDSVSPEEIQTADELLHEYGRDFQRLYGLRQPWTERSSTASFEHGCQKLGTLVCILLFYLRKSNI